MEYSDMDDIVIISSDDMLITWRRGEPCVELCASSPASIAEMDNEANDPYSPVECIGANSWSRLYRFPQELVTLADIPIFDDDVDLDDLDDIDWSEWADWADDTDWDYED